MTTYEKIPKRIMQKMDKIEKLTVELEKLIHGARPDICKWTFDVNGPGEQCLAKAMYRVRTYLGSLESLLTKGF